MRWRTPLREPRPRARDEVLAETRATSVAAGGHLILDSVSMTVHAGELVALVGPNGAGKSTLLGVLAADLPPDSGEVLVDGAPAASWTFAELALRRAVLPQQTNVTFPFLVEAVVRMGRAPWASTDAAERDDAIVATALAEADIVHLAGRQFPTLSGGERARVALARVLAQSTQLLLLDEPTAALDIHHQETVLQVVRRRVDEGAGAVVVLHDLGVAAAYADRVVVLDRARVAADGPAAAVLTAERLSRVYNHPIDVIPHPASGVPLVVPRR
jgi:iron complex transport system ATP-binding protein